jgi:hypothetical protein
MPRDYNPPSKPPASVRSKLKELHERRNLVENLIRAMDAYVGAPAGSQEKERTAA